MQLKSVIKIGILFTLIILIFIGGYFMFKTLKHNKQVFESELQSYIPFDANLVIQINNEQNFNELLSYIYNIDSLVYQIEHNISYPLFLIKKNKESSIIAKITSQQEKDLKETLQIDIFPFYKPKIEKYRDAELYFYTTSNNSFYCCTFYNGIFAGSYNYLDIQSIIDTKKDRENFFSNKKFDDLITDTKNLYPANIYIKDKKSIFAFNVSEKKDSIILEGSTNINLHDIENHFDSIKIETPPFPQSFKTLEITNKYPFTSVETYKWFNLPSYIFNSSLTTNEIIIIKINTDKFTIYDYLNNKNYELVKKDLEVNSLTLTGQRIYKTSDKLAEKIFKFKDSLFFTFYKDYFIYSLSKNQLETYLLDYKNSRQNYFSNSSLTYYSSFLSFDNSIILPLSIYSNKQQLFNSVINNISSDIAIRNKKIYLKIVATKKNN